MRRYALMIVLGCFLSAPTGVLAQVPAAMLKHAGESPIVVTMLLADAGIPAGLEVKTGDDIPPYRPDFSLTRDPPVPQASFVNAFNASHEKYQAAVIDGALVIRPVSNRAGYLDSPSNVGRVDVTGVMNAAEEVFSGLLPRNSGGHLGSRMMDAWQAGEYAVISLDGKGMKVIDLLNRIVSTSPRAWMVVTSNDQKPTRVLKFCLIASLGNATCESVPQEH